MNEAKVEEIETRLSKSFHDYIDVRKQYEVEFKKSHVYKENIEDFEAKVQELKDKVASLREKLSNVEKRATTK